MKLSHAARLVRNGIKFLLLFAVLYYLFVFFLIPSGKKLYLTLVPPKDPPRPIYGLLDPLEFVTRSVSNEKPTYVLNTKNGKLPTTLPNKMIVYRYKAPQFSYAAGKAAQQQAAFLGFSDSDLVTDLKGSIYKWRNGKTGADLTIYINSKELVLTTPLGGKIGYFVKGSINTSDGIAIAKNMFAAIGRLSDPLYISGTQVARLGRITQTGAVEAKLPEEAQIARVDFFRSIGTNKSYPILGPDAKKGLLQAYVRKSVLDDGNPTLNYPKVEAYQWEIDTQANASYAIIPVEEAWNAVLAGKGVISNVTPKNGNPFETVDKVKADRILVNDIYLAYYDTPKLQKYLQPVYVFEGNYTFSSVEGGNITIYYPAIVPQYIKQSVGTK